MRNELRDQYYECLESLNEAISNFKEMAKMLRRNNLEREAGYLESYATNYMTGFEDDALQQIFESIEEIDEEE